ncbi:hypothetical protein [Streptomyces echinatus]|uniref:Uncharacterized protein n=1 Tax=Streptomyces echinatus TaxID=67293 RepID=A0A7W9PY65_9ACTN|nr:hypothetical protein [Streptomyces echinatus]MBB5929197.1 hypothetical protein [Streptomyces echinatus]
MSAQRIRRLLAVYAAGVLLAGGTAVGAAGSAVAAPVHESSYSQHYNGGCDDWWRWSHGCYHDGYYHDGYYHDGYGYDGYDHDGGYGHDHDGYGYYGHDDDYGYGHDGYGHDGYDHDGYDHDGGYGGYYYAYDEGYGDW